MAEKSIRIRGVEWEYITGGRGERTLLMLHGAAGGAETMQWLCDAFADEYRTIAPTVADVSRLEEVTDAISAILDREHVGRAVVFGGSFGGLIAQAFAKRRLAQVEHLILLSTGLPNRTIGRRSGKMLKYLRLLPFPLIRGLMKLEISRHLNTPVPPEFEERIRLFRQRLDDYFNRRLTKQTLLSRIDLSVDFNSHESYGAEDFRDWPGKVLIIESSNDPMINEEERGRLRAAYPQAMLCIFDDAGHMIPLLRLEELVEVIRVFLN